MKDGNFLRKRKKRISKKTRKNMQNDAIKPQKREKSFKKQIFRLKTPDFTAISSKNRAKTSKKSPGKALRG